MADRNTYQKRNKGYGPYTPVWQIVVIDFIIAALIVGGWWLSRQASIRIEAYRFEKAYAEKAAAAEAAAAEAAAAQSQTTQTTPAIVEQAPVTEVQPSDEDIPSVEELESVPDNRTEWQKRFESFFTDEIVQTDSSYSSPNVSINITQGEIGEDKDKSVYYVADIHIGSIDCLSSYFARGLSFPSRTDLMPRMYNESNALAAINGDYSGLNFACLVLRNGVLIKDTPTTADICILFYDGSMECMNYTEYHAEDYANRPIYQIWTFGPSMMSSDGRAYQESEMDIPYYLSGVNPRTGIGYFEPGHYCFVVADGRQNGYSKGITIGEFAKIFESLGCVQAYNLDGGGSSSLMFNGKFYNKPSSYGERDMPDIILIREPATTEDITGRQEGS